MGKVLDYIDQFKFATPAFSERLAKKTFKQI